MAVEERGVHRPVDVEHHDDGVEIRTGLPQERLLFGVEAEGARGVFEVDRFPGRAAESHDRRKGTQACREAREVVVGPVGFGEAEGPAAPVAVHAGEGLRLVVEVAPVSLRESRRKAYARVREAAVDLHDVL
jgi:hypothetical protein